MRGQMELYDGAYTGPQDYTPVLGGGSLGNGTLTGHWRLTPSGLIYVSIELVLGSTTSLNGAPNTFSLPVEPASQRQLLSGTYRDDSVSVPYLLHGVVTAGTVQVRTSPSSAGGSLPAVSNSVPFTKAADDSMTISGIYEPSP